MLLLSKYHGCGNDFLITEKQGLTSAQKCALAKKLCERHIGIGADGMIFLKRNPLTMEIYNSDGSSAPMCGNGIRCLAKYALDQNIINQNDFYVYTKAGIKALHIHSKQPFSVSVNMGKASFDPHDTMLKDQRLINYPLRIENQLFNLTTVFMTTLHTVLFIEHDPVYVLKKFGKAIHEHPLFPQKTNVNFVRVIDRSHLSVSTYERGAGMTLACGSGCCAAAYVAWLQKLVDSPVQISLPQGNLQILIDEKECLIMRGGAEKIVDAFVTIPIL